MRRTLVSRSSRLKPRPLDRCVRTTSPSSTVTTRPRGRAVTLDDRIRGGRLARPGQSREPDAHTSRPLMSWRSRITRARQEPESKIDIVAADRARLLGGRPAGARTNRRTRSPQLGHLGRVERTVATFDELVDVIAVLERDGLAHGTWLPGRRGRDHFRPAAVPSATQPRSPPTGASAPSDEDSGDGREVGVRSWPAPP